MNEQYKQVVNNINNINNFSENEFGIKLKVFSFLSKWIDNCYSNFTVENVQFIREFCASFNDNPKLFRLSKNILSLIDQVDCFFNLYF